MPPNHTISLPAALLDSSALRTLSGATCRMAELIGADRAIHQVRRGLDAAPAVAEIQPGDEPIPTPPSGEERNRLHVKERTTVVIMSQGSLAAKEGEAAFCRPLARLEARDGTVFRRTVYPIFIAPLNGNEILSLEEKETRADYAAQLRMIDDRVAGFFMPISGSIPDSIDIDLADSQKMESVMNLAARVRDFGTSRSGSPNSTTSGIRSGMAWRCLLAPLVSPAYHLPPIRAHRDSPQHRAGRPR